MLSPEFLSSETGTSIIFSSSVTSPLNIPPTIDNSYLLPIPISPVPSSPGSDTSVTSTYTSYSSSDSEDLAISMEQINHVKRLLRMFPPPMSAKEFIEKNSFKASDGHIKRPSNNFILFRKIAHDQKNQTSDLTDYNEREFSKIIGKIWDGLTSDEKTTYKKLGKEVAEMHKILFPEYKYQPKRDKAAWKHFVPETNNTSSQKTRRKSKVKQQKHQETTEIPKDNNVNISQQQQQPQQQEIIQDNLYGLQTIPVDGMFFSYPDSNNAYATNNSYTSLDNINMFNVTDFSSIWSLNSL